MNKLNDSFTYVSDKLILRFYNADDFTAWQRLFSEMNPKVNQWDWEAEPISALTKERFTGKLERHALERTSGTVYYFCAEDKEGQLVGIGLINNIVEGSGEIGAQLNNRFWGKGYGTEIGEALIKIGLENVGLKTVTANVNKGNLAPLHILEKFGMKRIGENETQWIYGR